MGLISGYLKRKRHKLLANGDYQLLSYWTAAETVECSDNQTLQTKVTNMQDSGKIQAVSIVSALPADAADNPTTLYLVKE